MAEGKSIMGNRRLIVMLAVVAMVMGAMAPASAGGVSVDKMTNAGWTCVTAGPSDYDHCFDPTVEFGSSGPILANGKAFNVMVFDDDGGAYLGTELLRFSGTDLTEAGVSLPCPKDHGWHSLGGGLYACHHWKGAPS